MAAASNPCMVAREKIRVKGVVCTPPDNVFADKDGVVDDNTTPKLLIGARLCDRFIIKGYIESGAFGRGWTAIDEQGDDPTREMFIKTFRSVNDRPQMCDAAAHEKMVLKEIEVLLQADSHRIPDHPSLVNQSRVMYGTIEVPLTGQKGEMFFIASPDLCQGGELYNYLVFGNGIKKFSEKIARYFFKQLAEGVAHMHANGMFHRDLKLENVVLDSHYDSKIMDFGHAKHASECQQRVDKKDGAISYETETFVGTASYQPPELTQGSRTYDPAAFDVWSLGVILFFMVGIEGLAAKGNDFTFMTKLKRIEKGKQYLDQNRGKDGVPANVRLWEFFGSTLKFSPELKHLLNAMFDIMPKKRITIDKVLQHKWLHGEYPTHEEVVAALSGRSTGIVKRDLIVSLAEKFATQDEALNAVEAAVKRLAPYTKHGHKIGVCSPPKFAMAVGANRKIRVIWLSGGLDEWLEFRMLLLERLGVTPE